MQSRSSKGKDLLGALIDQYGERYGVQEPRSDAFDDIKSAVLTLTLRAIGNRDFEIGSTILKSASRLSLRDPTLLRAQALLHLAQGKKKEALSCYREFRRAHDVQTPKPFPVWVEFEQKYLPFLWELSGKPDVLDSTDKALRLDVIRCGLAERFVHRPSGAPPANARLFLRLLKEVPAEERRPNKDVDAKRRAAEKSFEDARYEDARQALHEVLRLPRGFEPATLLSLAKAETALSNYGIALKLLEFACWSSKDALAARSAMARIHWIRHEYDAGLQSIQVSLKAHSENKQLQKLAQLLEHPFEPSAQSTGNRHFTHVAFHALKGGNFGDIALPEAVEQAFEAHKHVDEWTRIHVHQTVGERQLEGMNATRAVVVGGGGLFLPDTSPNGVSGWQWNVGIEALGKIRVPLVVYAVGYNLFRGQRFPSSLFHESLVALTERAEYIGLRNRGSVRMVQNQLPPHLAQKVTLVPCPTTVLSRIHPAFRERPRVRSNGPIYLNVAYDRSARRFGDGYPRFLHEMSQFVRALRKQGHEIRYAAHLAGDEAFVRDLLSEFGIGVDVDRLSEMPLLDAYELYRNASLVIGMRGHASMIPFGLGTPIISIISHPKLRYFLDDIDRNEWGIDVDDPHFFELLLERTQDLLNRIDEVRSDISTLQDELMRLTDEHTARFDRI